MSGLEWVPAVESAALALGAGAGAGIWTEARNGILSLVRRAGRDDVGVAELLDETDARVRVADSAERDRVRERAARDWQLRLDDLFRRADGAPEELLAWTAEVTGRLPADQRHAVGTAGSSALIAISRAGRTRPAARRGIEDDRLLSPSVRLRSSAASRDYCRCNPF